MVFLRQTGQDFTTKLLSSVIASWPITSTSQITILAESKDICSLFFRNVRKTCQAISSVEKHPRPIAFPSASKTVGTYTRVTPLMVIVPSSRCLKPSALSRKNYPILAYFFQVNSM